ncbi:PEP-CTERM sorting domain-containing protein [Pontiella sulfatireligans]|uniref:Ice-binding protein C-terminal domain-containing protein n=1 Tax=Pontiella sulfatireligans TaxID=2750658 RepID=A0A6C2UEV4_9BACT|nr:PEP-CTERM sorting domain-containing protein [Pontiella sulfatireligans]VGO18710.1 hypothetical protein SCARR_00763 [Pontiella sulfatireligans]
MKKTFLILSVLAVAASVANATIYSWYSDGDLGDTDPGFDLFSVSGKSAESGHMAVLYKASSARSSGTWYQDMALYDNFSTSYGDMKVAETTIFSDRNWLFFEQDEDLEDSSHYFTVLFDVPVGGISAGNQFIVMDKKTQAPETGNEILCYDFSGSYSGIVWNDVQAVPEPATLSLFGLGGMGSWLLRRKR